MTKIQLDTEVTSILDVRLERAPGNILSGWLKCHIIATYQDSMLKEHLYPTQFDQYDFSSTHPEVILVVKDLLQTICETAENKDCAYFRILSI